MIVTVVANVAVQLFLLWLCRFVLFRVAGNKQMANCQRSLLNSIVDVVAVAIAVAVAVVARVAVFTLLALAGQFSPLNCKL